MKNRIIIGLACLAVIVAGLITWWASATQKKADDATAAKVVAEQKAEGAEIQSKASQGVARAVDKLARGEGAIALEVSRATESVRGALEDDAGVEPVVRAWAAGIDGLRKSAQAADADAPRDRRPAVDLRALHAHTPTGDAAAWLIGHDQADTALERPLLRGRYGARLERPYGTRPLDPRSI